MPDDGGDPQRITHKVRVFEDGEVIRLDKDGNAPGEGTNGGPSSGDDTVDNVNSSSDPNADATADNDNDRSYVDLERTDQVTIIRGTGQAYQKTIYTFDWPNDGIEHSPRRELEQKTIKAKSDTSSDATDPEQTEEPPVPVTIDIIKSLYATSVTSTSRGNYFLEKRWHFDNSGGNDGREAILNKTHGVDQEYIRRMGHDVGDTFWRTIFNVKWPKQDDTGSGTGGSMTSGGGDGINSDADYNQ